MQVIKPESKKSLGEAKKNRPCGVHESIVVQENIKKKLGYILVRLQDTEYSDSTLIQFEPNETVRAFAVRLTDFMVPTSMLNSSSNIT